MAIDIGEAAINRNNSLSSGRTRVARGNPANANGTITSIEIWAYSSMTGCIVGTFYTTNGNTPKCRDSEVLGAVTSGSKQTFSGLTIDTVAGDYIGTYYTSGRIESATFDGGGMWSASGEHIDPGDEYNYSLWATYVMSLYGIGVEVVVIVDGVASGGGIGLALALGERILLIQAHGSGIGTGQTLRALRILPNMIRPPAIRDLGRIKSIPYSLGRSLTEYTLGRKRR